ncbi:MAG: hypothetical protein ACRCYY_12250 [Trueperaceae bacterium]
MVMTPEYIIDNKGRKTKVVLPMKAYQELLEDLHDLVLPWRDVMKSV